MKIIATTFHRLEVGDGVVWSPVEAGMYKLANELAERGRLTEALEIATTIRIENYGLSESVGIKFRIATVTITQIE